MSKDEYVIINKSKLLKRIEEWELELQKCFKAPVGEFNSDYVSTLQQAITTARELLYLSTPLIPEIEKAMDIAREIKDDSAHDTFTVEDISGCIEVCTYGWRYKTTNEEYISNLKLDI